MKKLIVILVLLFAVSTVTVFAQSISIPAANVGKWLDPNWDAIWDLSTNNIRILDLDGSVIYNFSGMIQNWGVSMDGINPVVSFACQDVGKSYRFTFLLNGNWRMEITRPNEPLYTVELLKQ